MVRAATVLQIIKVWFNGSWQHSSRLPLVSAAAGGSAGGAAAAASRSVVPRYRPLVVR